MELIKERQFRAKKEYRCGFSGIEINKGDLYWRSFCVDDGGNPYEWNTCLLAQWLIGELDMYPRSMDGSLSDETYHDFLADYIRERDLWNQYYTCGEPEISQFVFESIISTRVALAVSRHGGIPRSRHSLEEDKDGLVRYLCFCPRCGEQIESGPSMCTNCATISSSEVEEL